MNKRRFALLFLLGAILVVLTAVVTIYVGALLRKVRWKGNYALVHSVAYASSVYFTDRHETPESLEALLSYSAAHDTLTPKSFSEIRRAVAYERLSPSSILLMDLNPRTDPIVNIYDLSTQTRITFQQFGGTVHREILPMPEH